MRSFHNLVYATTGDGDDTEGLKQALSLARNNQAALKIVLLYPEVPKNLEVYRETFEASLLNQVESAVETVRVALKMNEAEVSVRVEVKSGDIPFAIDIIRHVLCEAHDLLIKAAEPKEGGKGFSSTDMTLLRKCPCAVWLARPIVRSRKEVRVAVAISPESRDEAESDLSIRLLRLARSLSDTYSGELDIICCSEDTFEQYLRRNTRVSIPEETVRSAVQQVQSQHQAYLGRVIQSSGIGGAYHIRYLRERADKAIPNFVQINAVDLLVMGTVARSGIVGFLIGNTAESIMADLGCSLLALKPRGFISPVKAH